MGGFWPSYVYLLSRSSTRSSHARNYARCVEACHLEKTLFGTFFFQGSILQQLWSCAGSFQNLQKKLRQAERTHISKLCLDSRLLRKVPPLALVSQLCTPLRATALDITKTDAGKPNARGSPRPTPCICWACI